PVPRLVDGGIGRGALEADHVDPDVVRVVHLVALDAEVLHVAVHDHRLGRAQGEVRELVVHDLDLLDRMVAGGAEHGDPMRVPAVSALEARPHGADDVAGEPDVVGGARHQDPDRHVSGRVAPVPRDLEAADRDEAPGVDRDHGVLPRRNHERRAVEHDPFAGSRRERDRSSGQARGSDLDLLLVHALAHVHGRPRTHRICRVLKRGPRFVSGPRVGVVALDRHPVDGTLGRRRRSGVASGQRPHRDADEPETRDGERRDRPAFDAHRGWTARPFAASKSRPLCCAIPTRNREPGFGRSSGGRRSVIVARSLLPSASRAASWASRPPSAARASIDPWTSTSSPRGSTTSTETSNTGPSNASPTGCSPSGRIPTRTSPSGTCRSTNSTSPTEMRPLAALPFNRFIGGEPMNPATKTFAGWSYTSCGGPTCWRTPWQSTAIRSPSVIASTWSCVT